MSSLPSTRRARRGALLVLSSLLTIAALSGPAGAATSTKKDPFTILQPLDAATTTYVGRDATGTPLGIVVSPTGEAIGYLCDGTGKISVWFKGTYTARTGAVALTSASGGKLAYDLTAKKGTLNLAGKSSAVSLQRATGIAGVYREELRKGSTTAVLGWVVPNDGNITGQATVNGKAIAFASEPLDSIPPVATVPGPTTTIAVEVFSFAVGLRCRFNSFRQGFNTAQLSTADDAGDAAGVADARADKKKLLEQRADLGCNANANAAT